MKPITYNILTASTPEKLIALVHAALALGWQPLGGVAVAMNGHPDYGQMVFVQAVVRAEVSE